MHLPKLQLIIPAFFFAAYALPMNAPEYQWHPAQFDNHPESVLFQRSDTGIGALLNAAQELDRQDQATNREKGKRKQQPQVGEGMSPAKRRKQEEGQARRAEKEARKQAEENEEEEEDEEWMKKHEQQVRTLKKKQVEVSRLLEAQAHHEEPGKTWLQPCRGCEFSRDLNRLATCDGKLRCDNCQKHGVKECLYRLCQQCFDSNGRCGKVGGLRPCPPCIKKGIGAECRERPL